VTVAYRLAKPEQEQLANQTEKIMNPDEFRRLALALPEAEAKNHQATPDFRVHNKIFATLREDENRCVLNGLATEFSLIAFLPASSSIDRAQERIRVEVLTSGVLYSTARHIVRRPSRSRRPTPPG
jgi:hypothetical protein